MLNGLFFFGKLKVLANIISSKFDGIWIKKKNGQLSKESGKASINKGSFFV